MYAKEFGFSTSPTAGPISRSPEYVAPTIESRIPAFTHHREATIIVACTAHTRLTLKAIASMRISTSAFFITMSM